MHISPRSLRSAVAGLCLVVAAPMLVVGCGGGDGGARRASASAGASRPAEPMVVVPRLVGRRQDDAHRIAARRGLVIRWMGFTGKLANGRYNVTCVKVLRQSPAAGERRPRGASVSVIEAACRTPTEPPHGV